MLREYGLNYFKFDGIGVGGRPAGTTAEFASDMKALLRLISELRQVRPDVFINTTTGTWASPYWMVQRLHLAVRPGLGHAWLGLETPATDHLP